MAEFSPISTRRPSMRRGSTTGSAFAEPSFTDVLAEMKGSSVRRSLHDEAANVIDEIVMIADRAIAKRNDFGRMDMFKILRAFWNSCWNFFGGRDKG